MPKRIKLKIDRTPSAESTPGQRIAWLLHSVWGQNRSKMAADIGVTPSVLTKVATGRQNPGARLLDAIASYKRINPSWLLKGQGAPLLEEREGLSDVWPVPISQRLLPGPVDDYRDMLNGTSFPVEKSFFSPSRYWYRIPGSDPAVQAHKSKILAGDMLLIETDRKWWADWEDRLNRMCVIRGTRPNDVRLVQVLCLGGNEDPASLQAFDYASDEIVKNKSREFRIFEHPDGQVSFSHQYVNRRPSPATGARVKGQAAPEKRGVQFEISPTVVVGACIMLVRTDG